MVGYTMAHAKIQFRVRANRIWRASVVSFGSTLMVLAGHAATDFPLTTNVTWLQLRADAIGSLQLSGVVCAVNFKANALVLQDGSSAEVLRFSELPPGVTAGDCVKLEAAQCTLRRTPAGVAIASGAIVDNDGLHSMAERSGSVFLMTGLHVIQVDWFNYLGVLGLELAYEGPGMAKQRVPDSILFHRASTNADGGVLQPGLEYRAFEFAGHRVPEFTGLTPVRSGIARNVDPNVRTRDELVAVQFSGLIKINTDGLYRFHLKSDDGSRLSIEQLSPRVEMCGKTKPPPPRTFEDGWQWDNAQIGNWVELDGEVIAVNEQSDVLELEVRTSTALVRARLLPDGGPAPASLVGRQVRLVGVCRSAFTTDGRRVPGSLLAINWTELPTKEPFRQNAPGATQLAGDSPALPSLTTVEQVKRLTREQSLRGYPVKTRGVVTCVRTDFRSAVLQDATRGIYVNWLNVEDLPRVGQYWEVVGSSEPGDFAPCIRAQRASYLGEGRLPDPVHPTWDQLLNGSLDTQFVELQGVITSVDSDGVELLARGGKIRVALPDLQPDNVKRYENALVRLQGCLFASWDVRTHRVKNGEVSLYGAALMAQETFPVSPFAATLKSIPELKMFDLQASPFQRVRISGQVVHATAGEFHVAQGSDGVRCQARTADVHVGDLLEVAGFPNWNGPSPILQEAVARKTGSAPLPEARALTEEELVNEANESTRVRINGLLVTSRRDRDQFILEMQTGLRSFLARISAKESDAFKIPNGSRLELVGVYSLQRQRSAAQVVGFELLLNSPADIKVLAQPPWWTATRLLRALAVMAVALVVVALWVFTLRRRVSAQTWVIRQQVEREATLQERTRVAREIHDTLQQALAGLSMQLNAVAGKLRAAPGEALHILEVARSMVRHSQEETRRSVRDLRSFALEQGDLGDALSQMAAQASDGWPGRILVEVTGQRRRLPMRVESHLLRIGQEATNNAINHAAPETIRVTLNFAPEAVELSVTDDGRGFDIDHAAAGAAGHFGLLGMRERAEKIGASLQIRSIVGSGTTMELMLPLKNLSTNLPMTA